MAYFCIVRPAPLETKREVCKMSLRENDPPARKYPKRKPTGTYAPLATALSSFSDQQVLRFGDWCRLNGLSERTGRRIFSPARTARSSPSCRPKFSASPLPPIALGRKRARARKEVVHAKARRPSLYLTKAGPTRVSKAGKLKNTREAKPELVPIASRLQRSGLPRLSVVARQARSSEPSPPLNNLTRHFP